MPQVIVPALVAGVTAGSTFTLAAGLTLGFSTSAFVSSLVLSAAASALAPKPKLPNIGGGGNGGVDQSKTVTARQSNATRKLVYGEARIGGTFTFIESTDDDKYLHIVIVMAAHEINAFTTVYLDDEALTITNNVVTAPSKYNGLIDVYPVTVGSSANIPAPMIFGYLGVPAEAAPPSYSTNHKLTDQAYIYMRLKFDQDAFPQGLPNVSALVQGRKVYDTRTSTTGYSRNPAMIIRDYLTDATYGLGAVSSEIDDASFNAAANICDETVALSGGGTEVRYRFDGVVDTANTPRGNLEQMLTALNGALYYSNGKWSLKAGAYVTPTVTLDEDDFASGMTITTSNSARDSFNAIKGQFISPTSDYQSTDYPAVTSATFETEDNSEQRFLNLDLPFTSSASAAQRIAKQILYKNRQEISIKAQFKMTAFQFQVGDTVMITNSRLGFSQKVFEVISWRLNFDKDQATVDCELVETNSAVYDWSAEESDFQQDNTTLPDPFNIPAPTLVPSEDLQTYNQQSINVLIGTVSSTSIYARQFEVEAKLSTDTDYTSLGIGSGSKYTMVNVQPNSTYDIRARAINALGIKSAFTNEQYTVQGTAVDPSDVTGFTVNIVGQQADLKWTAIPDGDLSHYIVRHSPLTTGATFNNSRTLVKKIARPANTITVPALTGTYSIKAVDKFGKVSQNENSSIALVDSIQGFNFADSATEHPTFAGSKTDVIVVDSKLQLDTTNLFDSVSGNFDDATGLFDGGLGNIATIGTYDFANIIDLGAVYTGQAGSNIKLSQISHHTGTPASATTDVDLYVSSTQDDPAGSPTWTAYRPFVVGSYTARAFRFRAELTSTDSQETPAIDELVAEINLPTRSESDSDVQSGAGAKVITFATPFKTLLAVSISVGDMQSGDYYGITSKSATGFTITFYNSGGSPVDRLFDYVATGF